jgi:hypothetical protein
LADCSTLRRQTGRNETPFARRHEPGAFAALIEAAGDPKRVFTISSHDKARSQSTRVNIDELMAAGGLRSSDFLAQSM